ncbi:MAG: enoyl-CoA hydratase/isomerase family protein [Dehalococcoidia bacterium]|nr:enoyl-CoA hydratase/isomerase family protein [Dehalococcoidia bacterium]
MNDEGPPLRAFVVKEGSEGMGQQPQQIEIPPPSPNDVLYEKREGYALITLNRPVVLNAINWSILRRLSVALDKAEADDDVRAVVLTGAGRAFSSGGDIQSTPPPDDDPTPSGVDINLRIWNMPKPVIAAVRGYAVGQGHELAGTCDMTIAADDAVFGELQIRHGFGPPMLISPFITGLKQAKELLMLGERITAQEALRLGLVNRVVPADELLTAAEDLAKKLAALPQKTVQSNKMLVNRTYEIAGFRRALEYREDPLISAMLEGTHGDSPHLKVLREQGWEAFRASRDQLYKSGDASAQVPADGGV